jgi:hypothetical protein
LLGIHIKDIMMTINDKILKGLDKHFKQWQQLAEHVRAQVTPALKVQEALQKSLEPIIKAQNAFQKSLEPMLIAQKRMQEMVESIKLPNIVIPDMSPFTKQIAEFQKSMEGLISPAFEHLQRTFRELPPRTQEAILLLGEHGWYLDLEMPIPSLWKLKKALSEGNIEEAQEALISYFEDRLEKIQKSISEKFPHRAHLIEAAFNAHRRQEFKLSIPVLLAQTDGICKEIVNEYFFIKQNRRPRTAIYVEQIASDTYRAALLSPLAQTLPIGASENERSEGFRELNRHMVLHGESLDYGNKTNSLKAISLINYVAHVLTPENENP